MKKKIKILYLDHSNDYSGGQRSLLILVNQLDIKKYTPIVVVDYFSYETLKFFKKYNIKIIKIHYFNNKYFQYLLSPLVLFQLVVVSLRERVDLIHSNTFKTGALGGVLSKILSIPSIFRARLGIDVNNHGFVDRMIYELNDIIIANSKYVKKTFKERFSIKDNKIKVVYNPVDLIINLDTIFVSSFKKKYLVDNVFLIGVIGRIEAIKRIHELVEAINILIRSHNDFKVLLIGNPSHQDKGKYYTSIKDLITRYQLESYFFFVGFTDKIYEVISCLDLIVLCSEGEALPRSIIESQLLGKAVIASNSGGNCELIEDHLTGLLYQLGDPNDLSIKIEMLFQDNKLRIQLGQNAQKFAQNTFHENNTIKPETTFYRNLVNGF